MKRIIFPFLGGLMTLTLLVLGFLWLGAEAEEPVASLPIEATLLPIQVEVAQLPSPTPFPPTVTPSVVSTEVAFIPPTASVPQTNLAPATLPVSDWGNAENALPDIQAAGCVLMTGGPDMYVNVRDYPSLSAGIQRNIEPNRQYRVIAVAVESDGTWYGLERGWVGGSVVSVFGNTCPYLPNASKVVWRTFGHVDFANLNKYREVKNIKIEEYMLNYPMLIFDNGTIWYNPQGWQAPE